MVSVKSGLSKLEKLPVSSFIGIQQDQYHEKLASQKICLLGNE